MPVRHATVLPDGILRLDDWLPYQCSVITNRVSALLARMYHEELGIGVTEWRLLAHLGVHSPMSAKELAEATVMDQVGVTRALTLLVDKKLVSRRVDGADRRKVILRLSKAGAQAYARVIPLAQAMERELTDALSPAQRDALRDIMKALVQRAHTKLDSTRDWHELLVSAQKTAA